MRLPEISEAPAAREKACSASALTADSTSDPHWEGDPAALMIHYPIRFPILSKRSGYKQPSETGRWWVFTPWRNRCHGHNLTSDYDAQCNRA